MSDRQRCRVTVLMSLDAHRLFEVRILCVSDYYAWIFGYLAKQLTSATTLFVLMLLGSNRHKGRGRHLGGSIDVGSFLARCC